MSQPLSREDAERALRERTIARINRRLDILEKTPVGPVERRWVRLRERIGDTLLTLEAPTVGTTFGLHNFDEEHLAYDPITWGLLLRLLPPTTGRSGRVFLDVGCGAGRAVGWAARQPFDRVIGVELDEELVAKARKALQAGGRSVRARRVDFVHADASTWTVPDDVTDVYLFCPFVGSAFARWQEQLVASVDRRPRRVRILYALPLAERALIEHPRFRLLRRVATRPVGWTQCQASVFELT